MSKKLTAWSGVVPIKAKSCPSSTLYVGLSRLSSMARDCSRVNELLRWLVGWCRLLKMKKKTSKRTNSSSVLFLCSLPLHLSNQHRPLWSVCKLYVLVSNHLQVRGCRHAAQEDWLLHQWDHCLGIGHWLWCWRKKWEELGKNQTRLPSLMSWVKENNYQLCRNK